MKQENLKAKYGITDEELKRATDQINFGKIACSGMAVIALVDLVANGDIEGTASSNIVFKSSEHEQFYNEQLAKCRDKDSYHKALMYAIGINEVTRQHLNEIYNFKTRCIKWECLTAGWQTGSSIRTLRLAFNLFTGYTGDDDKIERYTVSELFGYSDVLFLLQTIAIRYEA